MKKITDKQRLDWLLTPGTRGMACVGLSGQMFQTFSRRSIDETMRFEAKIRKGENK